MRRSFFLLFFFILLQSLTVFGAKEQQYSLSDLKTMLRQKHTTRYRLILNLRISDFYYYNKVINEKNLDSTLYYARAAYAIKRANPALDPESWSKVNIAKVLIRRKRMDEAKAMLADGDLQFRKNLMLTLGRSYLFRSGEFKKDLDSAELFFNSSRKLSRLVHDVATEDLIQLYQITVKLERGDKEGTRPLYMALANECLRKNDIDGAAEAYSTLGDHYLFSEAKEKLAAYYKSMALFGLERNEVEKINMLRAIAELNFNSGKLDLAEKQLLQVVNWYKSHHYKHIQHVYSQLSGCYLFAGDLSNALFYALEAVNSAQQTESDETEVEYYSGLARIYNEMGDDSNSVLYYRKTLESLKKKKSEFMYTNLKDLSDYLIKEGKSNQVLKMLNTIHKTEDSTPLENELVAAIKGNCYQYQKNYPLAEKYYLEMLKWEGLAKVHTFSSSDSYHILADFYISQGAYSKAEYFLQKILQMPPGVYPLSRIKDVYLKLYRADSAKNDLATALVHYKRYKSINDTIFNKEKESQIQELLIKYGTDKKEADNQLLRKESMLQRDELKKADLIAKITISGTLALLLIIILLYTQFKNRKDANQMLVLHQREITSKNNSMQDLIDKQLKLLVEKEWLLKEIHHRVKNNLQVVVSLLNTQVNYTDDAVAVSAIRDSQNRMHSISLIHEKIFQSETVSSIDIRSYIVDLMKFLCDSFHYNQRINFEFEIPSLQFDIVQAMPLGLIINEAMTNIIKYAFPNNEYGKVTIVLEPIGDDYYNFSISDNGIGLPPGFDFESSNTLGMVLMQGLSQQIGGEISISSTEGVSVSVKFLLVKPNETLYQYNTAET
ncbi:MAG: histidine kinase dimerization/phosphoacceptor domain -containing protein [Pedobacter sp.]|uniref:tetratricopeptide repeat-containing sensor histidine kinase n=1 Tax=Pedobacter sp. TaxID=1411316 RepID=UPI0033951C2F